MEEGHNATNKENEKRERNTVGIQTNIRITLEKDQTGFGEQMLSQPGARQRYSSIDLDPRTFRKRVLAVDWRRANAETRYASFLQQRQRHNHHHYHYYHHCKHYYFHTHTHTVT